MPESVVAKFSDSALSKARLYGFLKVTLNFLGSKSGV
jgi:hypothetical protein